MAIRKCPQCLAVVPAGWAAAQSDEIVCPGCRAPLEVAGVSRHVAVWLGVGGGVAGWAALRGVEHVIGFVLAVFGAILGYGIVSALVTMFSADLRNRVLKPVAEPAAADHGHGSAHH